MKLFEDIVGKGENAGNQRFLPFSKFFLLFPSQMTICTSLESNNEPFPKKALVFMCLH